jgi:adenylate cyclase
MQRVDRPLIREHLDAALRLAPDYARAKALLASSTTLAIALSESLDRQEFDRSIRLAREVLDDPSIDPESRVRSGYALALLGGDFEGGLAQIDLALEQSPNLVEACMSSAVILAIQADPTAAIARADRALRLSPLDPLAYRANVARSIAYLRLGEFEKALDAAKRITKTARRVQNGLRFEVVALVHLGRLEDARAAAGRLLAIAPNFAISKYVSAVRWFPDHLTRIVIEGLRKVGLPE